jgi:hypothetical protein
MMKQIAERIARLEAELTQLRRAQQAGDKLMTDLTGTDPIDGYFGLCPQCHDYTGCINVGRSHWLYCKEHRVKWCAGSNLFDSWRAENEAEQRKRYDEIGLGEFDRLERPFYPHARPHHSTWEQDARERRPIEADEICQRQEEQLIRLKVARRVADCAAAGRRRLLPADMDSESAERIVWQRIYNDWCGMDRAALGGEIPF